MLDTKLSDGSLSDESGVSGGWSGVPDAVLAKRRRRQTPEANASDPTRQGGMELFAFLVFLFQRVKDRDGGDYSSAEGSGSERDELSPSELALTLGGIDSGALSKTMDDIRSDKISIFEAAENTAIQTINHNKTGAENPLFSTSSGINMEKLVRVSSPKISSLGKIEIGERQKIVIDTIQKAAAATGINPEYMKGLWGFESGFGKNLVSPTGCEGDWQFSQSTWDSIMQKDGLKIANLVSNPEKAEEIRRLYAAKGTLDKYQYDPEVSTYAAAFLNQRNAKALGINPNSRESWGVMYSAYNVGTKSAKELLRLESQGDQSSVMSRIGSAAKNNPYFYTNGATASAALDRYQSVIEARLGDYNKHLAYIEKAPDSTMIAQNSTLTRTFAKGGVEQPPSQGNLTPAFSGTVAAGGIKEVDKTSVDVAAWASQPSKISFTTKPA